MLSASGGRRRPLTRLKPIHHSEALRVLDLGDSNMPHGVGGEGSVESGVTAAGAAAGFRAPLCKVCCENGATVFCRNDSAWLCDACDAAVHLSNPLSACHEILPLNSYLLQQVTMGTGWGDAGMLGTTPPGTPVSESVLLGSQLVPAALVTAADSRLHGQPVERALATPSMDRMAQVPVVEFLPVECGPVAFGRERIQDFEVGNEFVETMDAIKENNSCREGAISHNDQGAINVDDPNSFGRSVPHWIMPGTSHCRVPGGVQFVQFPAQPFHQFSPIVPQTSSSIIDSSVSMASIRTNWPSDLWLARKARVARYLQKKKNRIWGNRIRYESRKAYAENRPRIKGRFARPDEFKAYLKQQEALKTK